MKSTLSEQSLNFTLKFFSNKMNGKCEYFLFFGSLLGMVREGKPIAGDDDVDFYVNKKDYTFIKTMLSQMGISINYDIWPNHTEYFIQANAILENMEIRADFYFYDNECDLHFLKENWNFPGQPDNPANVLKMPKPLIFPLKKIMWQETELYLPRYPEIVVEMLYGINWKIPQRKGIDYVTKIHGGRPLRFVKNGQEIKLLP
jgi:hypothetical protein